MYLSKQISVQLCNSLALLLFEEVGHIQLFVWKNQSNISCFFQHSRFVCLCIGWRRRSTWVIWPIFSLRLMDASFFWTNVVSASSVDERKAEPAQEQSSKRATAAKNKGRPVGQAILVLLFSFRARTLVLELFVSLLLPFCFVKITPPFSNSDFSNIGFEA